MRVSNQMIFNSFVSRFQKQSASILKLQQQVTGGKRVNKPSDDPIAQAEILNFQKSIDVGDQYIRNINRLESMVGASDIALQGVQDQLLRVRELAVQAGNATNTAADRAIMAQEVRQIYDQMIAMANTRHEGAYIFAGNETDTEPFVSKGYYTGTDISSGFPLTITGGSNDTLTLSIDGTSSVITLAAGTYTTGALLATQVQTQLDADSTYQSAGVSATASFNSSDQLVLTSNEVGGTSALVPSSGTAQSALGLSAGTSRPAGTYLGDTAENAIRIGKNVTVIKNLPGGRVFETSGSEVFTTIANLQSALESNNISNIQTELTNLTSVSSQINDERALIGARLNRAESTTSLLTDFKLTLQSLKSDREDIDLAAAISDLSLQQTLLEASQATFARISQSSLLNFLR